LRMTFRVHTERKGSTAVLAEGPDLGDLQRTLTRESGEAVRTAVRSALIEARRRAGASDLPSPAELAGGAEGAGAAAPAAGADDADGTMPAATGPLEQSPL